MDDERGKFIVIEGNDGAGKTTQISLIKDYIHSKGRKVFVTKEPSQSEYGKEIRRLVISESGSKLSDDEWLELFTLDRNEHIEKEITPALVKGNIVLCDRYYYSTCIYQ